MHLGGLRVRVMASLQYRSYLRGAHSSKKIQLSASLRLYVTRLIVAVMSVNRITVHSAQEQYNTSYYGL
jgi:hypothetical protein